MAQHAKPLVIQTCILQQKQFVPLETISKLYLKDPGRVEGSVRITANGVELITDLNWTELVQWWAQMINILNDLVISKKHSTDGFFPDFPTIMQFSVSGSLLTWEVCDTTTRSITLDFESTTRALFDACETFFTRIRILNPDSPYDQDLPLADLAKLAPSIRERSQMT